MRRLTTALLLLLPFAGGCIAHGPMQRADTIGEGNFQFAAEPGIMGAAAGGTSLFVPAFDISARYGVSDRVDLGVRLGSTGYELMGKFMLNDPNSDMPISIAPNAAAIGAGGGGAGAFFIYGNVPVLIGIPMGQNQLVLGPGIQVAAGGAGGGGTGGGAAIGFQPNLTTGFNLRVADGLQLHPELYLGLPLGAAIGTGGGSAGSSNGILYGFRFAIIGGKHRNPKG